MRLVIPGVGAARDRFSFEHDGTDIEAQEGDTLAVALINSGRLTCRIAGDGTPRGVFCGMGACGECSMVVDGVPGVLACMTKASAGLVVDTLTAISSVGRSIASEDGHVELSPDVLVVGAGPAGLAAAATIAESGAEVVVIDERTNLGGQFYKQPPVSRTVDPSKLDPQFRAGRNLATRVETAGARVIMGTVVWGVFSSDFLVAQGNGVSWTLRPRRLVLATGAQERPLPLPGWTLPGVMMTGAAQTLVRSGQVSPGQRVLVAGNGPLNMQVAAELTKAGVKVAALVERADLRPHNALGAGLGMVSSAPGLVRRGLRYRSILARARVPVIDRAVVTELYGGDAVNRVSIGSVDAMGRAIEGPSREFEVDSVCLGYGFIPATEMSRSLGCSHTVDPGSGTFVPICTPTGKTSVDNVWVVGDSGGIAGAHVAQSMGETAAADVIASLGMVDRSSSRRLRKRSRELRRHRRFQRSLWGLYGTTPLALELVRNETTLCRCESVSYGELRQCFESGVTTLGAVKRLTRAGMGHCQGRYCSMSLLALSDEFAGGPVDEFSGFAPQVPIRPTEIRHIAGSVNGPTNDEET